MDFVYLKNLTHHGKKHQRINGVNEKSDVSKLREIVSTVTGIRNKEFDLIYAGKCLRDGKPLSYYGIKNGISVHVIQRAFDENPPKAEPVDQETIDHIVTSLQSAMQHPAFRSTIDRMLENPEAIENIIAATPQLDSDPIAVAMLHNPEMLAVMADQDLIQKVIKAHPALGPAAMMVAASLNEEMNSASTQAARESNRGTYSLDRMDEEEEMEGISSAPSGAGITPSQLAAALAGVGALSAPPSSAQASNSQTSEASSSQQQISADFFQNALSQALGGSGQPGPSLEPQQLQQQPPEDVTQDQLAQLRDMGITDEAVARQALRISGGDLQAALEILFGDALS